MSLITATPESTRRHSSMLNIFRAVIAVFQRKPRRGHPWSAYKPATYRAGVAPAGIVIATRARSLVSATTTQPAASMAELVAAGQNTAASVTDTPDTAAANPPATPQAPQAQAAGASEAIATLPPAIAAHQGLDLALAARLHSVAVLNRRLSGASVRRDDVRPRRSRKIEPPAVLRKPRQRSAEVIQLDLALHRARRNAAKAARHAA